MVIYLNCYCIIILVTKMRCWKILVAIIILGILAMPATVPHADAWSSPSSSGHIVFARNRTSILPDFGYWHHACLYKGSSKVIQADPECENWKDPYDWNLFWKGYFSVTQSSKVYWFTQLEQSLESRNVGGSEIKPLSYIFQWYKGRVDYGYVKGVGYNGKRGAVEFAEDKADEERPFDFVSYWAKDTKQIDENDPNDPHHGYRYYCAELVWAAYQYATGKDLDKNNRGRVQPIEIHNDDDVYVYRHYYYPW